MSRPERTPWSVLLAALCACIVPGFGTRAEARTQSTEEPAAGALFDAVARRLERQLLRGTFRSETLPALVRDLRPRARAARDLEHERAVVQELLEHVPYSHVGLLSDAAHSGLQDALNGRPHPGLGFQVVDLGEGLFVTWLEAGGPAEQAGVRRGARVLSLDGVPVRHSPRLDRRTDDASLPDPPLHAILCRAGERVRVELEERPGRTRTVLLEARERAFGDVLEAGMRVLDVEGARVALVHPWYVPSSGLASRLADWIEGPWSDCDALVLDLRGRGGMLHEARRVLALLDPRSGRWERPLVVLVDRTTRSAKEILADELQREGGALLVGEPTAGAVVPASFARVGRDDWLMFPGASLGELSRRLEGEPRQPDVEVPDRLAWADGADPILEAGLLAAAEWHRVRAGR